MRVLTVVLACCGLVLCLAGAGSDAALGTIGEQVSGLLGEETKMREQLGARIAALRTEASTLAGQITPCACNMTGTKPPRVPQVAYTGVLHETLTSLTTASRFNFTDDLVNVGRPFNVTSGNFTVPVTGVYAFSLTMYMASTGYWTSLNLARNDVPFLYVRTGHYSSRQANMATNLALVNATVGDEISVNYVSSSGSRVYANGVSTFTGVLLFER